MPDINLQRKRFEELRIHSVGPGTTKSETKLEERQQIFVRGVRPWRNRLQGPVLDFGCSVGCLVMDLPRPYMRLDLLPEHVEIWRANVTFPESCLLPASYKFGLGLRSDWALEDYLPEGAYFNVTLSGGVAKIRTRYRIGASGKKIEVSLCSQ